MNIVNYLRIICRIHGHENISWLDVSIYDRLVMYNFVDLRLTSSIGIKLE